MLRIMRPVYLKTVVATLLCAASLSCLGYPYTTQDQSMFVLGGRTVLDGGALYRDFWDVKGPGVFLDYAAGIATFGDSATGMHVFDLIWQSLTAVLLGAIAGRIYQADYARWLAASAYLIFYYSQPFWNWMQADGFLSLPLALSVWLLLECRWVLAGACIGIAALFKLPFVIFGIAVFVAGRRWYWFSLGVAIPLIVFALYLGALGSLQDYLESQLIYAPQYVAATRKGFGIECVLRSLSRSWIYPLYVLAILGLLARFGSWKFSRAEILVLAWLGVSLTIVVSHGSFLTYHFLPVTPALCLWAAKVANSGRYRLAAVAIVLLAMAIPVRNIARHARVTFQSGFDDSRAETIGRYVAERTAPETRIFIWGNSPKIYLTSQRRPASRFVNLYPVGQQWKNLNYRDVLMRDLDVNPPTLILVAERNPPSPCVFPENWGLFPALRSKLDSEYMLSGQIESFTVYVRRTEFRSVEVQSAGEFCGLRVR